MENGPSAASAASIAASSRWLRTVSLEAVLIKAGDHERSLHGRQFRSQRRRHPRQQRGSTTRHDLPLGIRGHHQCRGERPAAGSAAGSDHGATRARSRVDSWLLGFCRRPLCVGARPLGSSATAMPDVRRSTLATTPWQLRLYPGLLALGAPLNFIPKRNCKMLINDIYPSLPRHSGDPDAPEPAAIALEVAVAPFSHLG